MSYYGVPEEKIHVIYTGIDQQLFNPTVKELYRSTLRSELNIREIDRVLLFVSHNWQRKGMEAILLALRHLGQDAKHYKLIGIGKSNKENFLKLAEKLDLQERIYFMDKIEDIEKYYAAADIFLLPTMYDPCSNVCIEAMACGVPVITTASNGASELIKQGLSGFILNDPFDFRTLASFIQQLTNDTLLNEMGKQAVQAVRHLTIEENLNSTIEVFRKVIEGKK
jgi:UDP-glucose:(heptosyl)LPS alpha-1,3-glucosyltransferase